jgi:hypothetical protein
LQTLYHTNDHGCVQQDNLQGSLSSTSGQHHLGVGAGRRLDELMRQRQTCLPTTMICTRCIKAKEQAASSVLAVVDDWLERIDLNYAGGSQPRL